MSGELQKKPGGGKSPGFSHPVSDVVKYLRTILPAWLKKEEEDDG
jgi:hypothetical protein